MSGAPATLDRPIESATPSRPHKRLHTTRVSHFAALDGLRGVAVVMVLARHASALPAPTDSVAAFMHGVMRAGWIGVDVFFALSGFLIAGILIDTRERPGFLRNFYARRALRIFPLYYATLAILFCVLPFTSLGSTAGFRELQANAAWFWTYTVNILIPLHGASTSPINMAHMWSLAVEEQFYLLWPWVVLWVPPRRLVSTCLVLAASAVALRVGLVLSAGWGTDWGYMFMPARMDALLLGALLAVLFRRPAAWARVLTWYRPLGIAAFVVLVALVAWRGGLDRNDPYVQVVGYVALSVVATACIARLVSAGKRGVFARTLESDLLRAFGKYSYAIYIFQYPIMRWLRDQMLPKVPPAIRDSALASELTLFAVGTMMAFALAWLSWRVLEQPFLSFKRFFPRGDEA